MNIFKMIIDFYKKYQQKEKEYIEQLEKISEKVQEGITLADQIIDVLKQNKKLKEKNNRLTKKCDCLTICNDELQDLLSNDIDVLEQLLEQHTKAKELLKKWVDLHLTTSVQTKTEQFLKEKEK